MSARSSWIKSRNTPAAYHRCVIDKHAARRELVTKLESALETVTRRPRLRHRDRFDLLTHRITRIGSCVNQLGGKHVGASSPRSSTVTLR
jgi:hypothetical protein